MQDTEWRDFYQEFIEPFITCQPGPNMTAPVEGLKTCFSDYTKGKLDVFPADDAFIKKVFQYLDTHVDDGLTLFHYVFLRRINNGMKSCSDIGGLSPVLFLFNLNLIQFKLKS